MTAPITIEVTAEDIAAGARCEPGHCALALAIGRVFPRSRIQVLPGVLGVEIDFYTWDHDAAWFIRAFDAGEPVEPCTITLTPRKP